MERIRAQIDQLFASQQDLGQVLEQVARLSVRLVMQAAVEAEVTEFLGRDRYARGAWAATAMPVVSVSAPGIAMAMLSSR